MTKQCKKDTAENGLETCEIYTPSLIAEKTTWKRVGAGYIGKRMVNAKP